MVNSMLMSKQIFSPFCTSTCYKWYLLCYVPWVEADFELLVPWYLTKTNGIRILFIVIKFIRKKIKIPTEKKMLGRYLPILFPRT